MLNDDVTEELRAILIDRFTSEELIEILGIDVGRLFDVFTDEVLEVDWSEEL